MNMRRSVLVVLVVLALVISACGAQKTGKMSFSIVTGGTGGVWYPLGGAIGGLITKNVADTDATSEATTAAIDNLKLLTAGKAGMAFAYDYHAVWANENKLPAVSDKKQNVRVVMGFYEQPLHVVTKEGTGIKSVTDLKGKRVSTGAPNSGTEEQADYVFKALGINWDKDLTREKLGASESVAALKDGKIDAFFYGVGHPSANIQDPATTCGAKLVSITGADVDKLLRDKPYYAVAQIPGGLYPNNAEGARTYGVLATVVSSAKVPSETIYQVVKAVFENFDEFKRLHPALAHLKPENMVKDGLSAPLHDGAARYYREKGWIK